MRDEVFCQRVLMRSPAWMARFCGDAGSGVISAESLRLSPTGTESDLTETEHISSGLPWRGTKQTGNL
jgi:hypothetical protein